MCSTLDSMIEAGTPPDIVLDLTTAGVTRLVGIFIFSFLFCSNSPGSESLKSLFLMLGLPTLSAAYGGQGDIM